MMGMCPKCGHSILNHKKGGCLVIVKLWGSEREPTKAHCGCNHYTKPIETQQRLSFKGIEVPFDPD